MNIIFIGILAGLAAAPAWMVVNLLVDFLFLPVIRRHSDQFNEAFLARPAVNLLILVIDIAFWGALFGVIYAMIYPGIAHYGLSAGVLWGFFLFISFSRGIIESRIWSKVPNDVLVFFFLEGLAGLLAWGAAFGPIFGRMIA